MFRSRLRFRLCGGLWQELFEVFQKIRSRIEELRYLRIHVLDGLRLLLICLEYFKELFVDFGLRRKAILQPISVIRQVLLHALLSDPHLDFVDISNSMIELYRASPFHAKLNTRIDCRIAQSCRSLTKSNLTCTW